MDIFTKASSYTAKQEMAWEIQAEKGKNIKTSAFFSEYIYNYDLSTEWFYDADKITFS